ncbi:MAG TPA: lytic transglycosylase domain-containing protein [Nocardioidaceae bacterium]|nr:lytic transglycosylase domain-containing protein [Nocardioidaceae bacterium]
MPRRDQYVPKHRNAPAEPAVKKSLRKSVLFSGVAVAATGLAVSGGVLAQESAPAGASTGAISTVRSDRLQPSTAPASDRGQQVSRSSERAPLDPAKKDALSQESGGQVTKTEDLTTEDPRTIARAMLGDYGFSEAEFSCLDALWVSESDWDMHADNPTSSAYGIPQALTGGTHDLPGDYMTNPVSQIEWGLWYIENSYGSPCSAWEFKQANNWY